MKTRIIIFGIMLFGIITASAQSTSYTMFEWDVVSGGVSIPISEDNLKGGLAIGGEVRYNAADNFSIGLGSEFSFFDIEKWDNLQTGEEATIDFSHTGFLSGDYYWNTTSPNRGFIGLAVGHTTIGDIEVTGGSEDTSLIEGESGMSLVPRLGYELGHARFLLQYNIGLKEELSNYMSLKVSWTLWGGYKG